MDSDRITEDVPLLPAVHAMLGLDAVGTSQTLLRNQSKMEERSLRTKHATTEIAAPKPLKE
jgi:hypothetical protein